MSIVQIFDDVTFSHVRAAIFDTDARTQVVEITAVQLEEFNKQDAQVGVWGRGINARMKLQKETRRKIGEWYFISYTVLHLNFLFKFEKKCRPNGGIEEMNNIQVTE